MLLHCRGEHFFRLAACVYCLDLLENGRTTGQVARLLYEPARRERLERKEAKEAEELSKASKKAGGKAADDKAAKTGNKAKVPEPAQSHGSLEKEEDEEEEEEMMDEIVVPSRHWYSLICYGLPNLVVTTGKN